MILGIVVWLILQPHECEDFERVGFHEFVGRRGMLRFETLPEASVSLTGFLKYVSLVLRFTEGIEHE